MDREQPRTFNEWFDRGDLTADSFARSAIGELPRVTVRPVALDPKAWGFDSREEMEAAWAEQDIGA